MMSSFHSIVLLAAITTLGCSGGAPRPITGSDHLGPSLATNTRYRVVEPVTIQAPLGQEYVLPAGDYPATKADRHGIFYAAPGGVLFRKGKQEQTLPGGIHMPSRGGHYYSFASLYVEFDLGLKKLPLPKEVGESYGTKLVVIADGMKIDSDHPQLILPPERFVQKGFSFVPLNEPGWSVTARYESEIGIFKPGPNEGETFLIGGLVENIVPYSSREEFLGGLKESERFAAPGSRIRTSELKSVEGKGADCAELDTVVEDEPRARGASSSLRTEIRLTRTRSLLCAHPKAKTALVRLVYSHRFYPGQEDEAFERNAAELLGSFQFADL